MKSINFEAIFYNKNITINGIACKQLFQIHIPSPETNFPTIIRCCSRCIQVYLRCFSTVKIKTRFNKKCRPFLWKHFTMKIKCIMRISICIFMAINRRNLFKNPILNRMNGNESAAVFRLQLKTPSRTNYFLLLQLAL